MKQAAQFFTDEEKRQIEEAVKAAESRTVGEIVPVLATASGRYDRAEDIVGLLTAVLALAAGWLLLPVMHRSPDWSDGLLQSAAGLLPAIGCMIVGFIAGSALASWFPALRLPFVRPSEMQEDVERAARVAFMTHRAGKTAAATGVLLYVSLFERRVVVLPDEGIGVTQPDVWREVRDRLIDGLKQGTGAAGFVEAIAICGDILAARSPRLPDDVDELPNSLIILK